MGRVTSIAALAALLVCAAITRAQHYDVLIRNGMVLDGTGVPAYRADVAVHDRRIAAIAPPGRIAARHAGTIIEARGMIVAPGFIDMLGQTERSILRDPRLLSRIYQGITTEITGEGNSIAPRNDAMIAADHPASSIKFRTLAEYFARLQQQGIGVNLASYVGATTVRRMVLGDQDRAPTSAELATMQSLVQDAMHQGALGLSSSLMYAPAPYATTEELIALASTAAASGGIYATHMRSEADGIVPALNETFRIAREAKIPVEIFHLKVAGPGNWGKMPDIVQSINAARAQGLDIAADTYAYTISGNSFSAFLPPWAHEGGDAAMLARLNDPAQRSRIREAILHDRTWDNEWFMVSGPESISLASSTNPQIVPLLGKTLARIAAARHIDPVDCILDLVAQDPGITVLLATMSEADIAFALKQPWMSIGIDAPEPPPDSSAHSHPRAYATFPRIVNKYVREDGLLSLPEAVRRFTSLPAARLHLADRGTVKVGMWADLVVFNPRHFREKATFDNPTRQPVGMRDVLVNGVPVLRDHTPTGELPGQVLHGPGYEHL